MSSLRLDGVVEALAAAWTEGLGVPAGHDSDFLALGGTSMIAMRVIEVLTDGYPELEHYDAVLLDMIFRCSSLREMAEELRQTLSEHAAPGEMSPEWDGTAG